MRMVNHPLGHSIYVESKTSYRATSPIRSLHGSKNQRVEAGVTILALTPLLGNYPFGKFGPLIPKARASAELEFLFSNGRPPQPRERYQQPRRVTILAEVIDTNHQEEAVL